MRRRSLRRRGRQHQRCRRHARSGGGRDASPGGARRRTPPAAPPLPRRPLWRARPARRGCADHHGGAVGARMNQRTAVHGGGERTPYWGRDRGRRCGVGPTAGASRRAHKPCGRAHPAVTPVFPVDGNVARALGNRASPPPVGIPPRLCVRIRLARPIMEGTYCRPPAGALPGTLGACHMRRSPAAASVVTSQARSRSVAAQGVLRRGHTVPLRAKRWSATVWGAVLGGASPIRLRRLCAPWEAATASASTHPPAPTAAEPGTPLSLPHSLWGWSPWRAVRLWVPRRRRRRTPSALPW